MNWKFRRTKVDRAENWLLALSVAWGVAALTAGITTLVMGRRNSGKPSRNAPQLRVENPGTQAEFPTAATESEVG